jgi:hypothetical protein
MLPGFSYQEQHLICFVWSSIRVCGHVVARWTLEGAPSCPILVPKQSLSSTIAGARSWPRTIYPPLPSSNAATQPSPAPRSHRDSFQYLAYIVSMSPPLLRLPNCRICNIRTQRSPETPHDRVCHLSAIHARVVVAFVVLVLLGEEPTVFIALRHYRLGGGLRAGGVRGGHYCGCRARRGLIGDRRFINEAGMRAEDLRCAFERVCDLRAANCRSASARTIINNSGLVQLLPCSYSHFPISRAL